MFENMLNLISFSIVSFLWKKKNRGICDKRKLHNLQQKAILKATVVTSFELTVLQRLVG